MAHAAPAKLSRFVNSAVNSRAIVTPGWSAPLTGGNEHDYGTGERSGQVRTIERTLSARIYGGLYADIWENALESGALSLEQPSR